MNAIMFYSVTFVATLGAVVINMCVCPEWERNQCIACNLRDAITSNYMLDKATS